MNLLQPGDRYDTVTNMRFWQLDAINDTRFLDANISAVRRGANIRRVFLIEKGKLADSDTAKGYKEVLEIHRTAQARANGPGGAGGRLQTRVVYADDFQATRSKYGHFGIASRPAVGQEAPDTLVIEPIYRGGNARDGGITELDFLFPKVGHPEMDRFQDLMFNFEAPFSRAKPLSDDDPSDA